MQKIAPGPNYTGVTNTHLITTGHAPSDMVNGNNLVKAYGVSSTPTLVVNGKYRVEMNAEKKIGPNEALEIALMLVKQEAAAAAKR